MCEYKDIINDISEAEMILIGLGEEFDDMKTMKCEEGFSDLNDRILNSSYAWVSPLMQSKYRVHNADNIKCALMKLCDLVKDKNYFVISNSINEVITSIPWKKERVVLPCGNITKLQCSNGCKEQVYPVNGIMMQKINELPKSQFEKMAENEEFSELKKILGNCPNCGKQLIFNSIYADEYNENGYLNDWSIYTKWLQGSVNRKLLILEFGVLMKYPSVIRFPFEKMAFYNNKSKFYRVNQSLYHMTEELKDKGLSIKENAIEWLLQL